MIPTECEPGMLIRIRYPNGNMYYTTLQDKLPWSYLDGAFIVNVTSGDAGGYDLMEYAETAGDDDPD